MLPREGQKPERALISHSFHTISFPILSSGFI